MVSLDNIIILYIYLFTTILLESFHNQFKSNRGKKLNEIPIKIWNDYNMSEIEYMCCWQSFLMIPTVSDLFFYLNPNLMKHLIKVISCVIGKTDYTKKAQFSLSAIDYIAFYSKINIIFIWAQIIRFTKFKTEKKNYVKLHIWLEKMLWENQNYFCFYMQKSVFFLYKITKSKIYKDFFSA